MLQFLRKRVTTLSVGGIALVLLVLTGTAAAATYLATAVYGIRWQPMGAAPDNCTTGKACSWVSSVDNALYYKAPDGTTTNLLGGAGAAWVVAVTAYGATGNGTTDDTSAIQAAVAAAPTGGTIYFPPGTYKVTDTITFAKHYTHVQGAGLIGTTIKFLPTSTKTCFKFDAGTELAGSSLKDMSFSSSASNTQTKTAVEIIDATGFEFRNIWIDPSTTNGTFKGHNSVGVQVRGREYLTFDQVRIVADNPMIFSDDPYLVGTVDNDHTHISNTYLFSTQNGSGSRALIKIDDGAITTNWVIDGVNVWIVDKYGLYWSDTTSTSTSFDISISGVRCEQAVDATGYCIYVDHTYGIFNMMLDNVHTASAQNGLLFKGITNLTLKNIESDINSGSRYHLTTDRLTDLFIENCFWQANTLASLTAMTLVWSVPTVLAASALPPTAWYSDSTTAATTSRWNNLTSVMQGRANILNNPSTANTLPTTFDTTNAYTTTSDAFVWKTAGNKIASIAGNGSVNSVHLRGISSAPTIVVGSSNVLGTTPSAAVTAGTDEAGTVTITTGTGPNAFVANTIVTLATVTYNVAYTGFAPHVVLVPHNAVTAEAISSGVIFLSNRLSNNTTTFLIRAVSSGTPTLAASTGYEIGYMIIGQ